MATVATPSDQKTFEEEQQQETQLTHNRLVQRLLGSGANLPAFMAELARTQAAVVAGTEACAFVLERDPQGGTGLKLVQHIRNDNAGPEVRKRAQEAFRQIAGKCVQEGRDGAIIVGEAKGSDDPEGPQYCIVTLLRNEQAIVAVSAVICRCRNDDLAAQRLQAMQLVAGYFDLYTLRRAHDQSKSVAKSHQDVLQLAGAFATGDGFKAASAGLCNELATRMGATRVALGWIKQGIKKENDIVLQAISHTEEFDKKQELSVQLVKVMEECYDQQEVVQFDPAGGSTENISREAQKLSQMEGGNRVLSVPLRKHANKNEDTDEIEGVLTLELPPEKPASQQEATTLAVAAELLAPQLRDRYDNDRWITTKAAVSSQKTLGMLIGPRHMLGKLVAVSLLALAVFLVLPIAEYRVTAPFTFEPVGKRIVSAPVEGPVREVMVRPGDRVEQGDVLLAFDTRDLETERVSALTDANSYNVQANQAEQEGKIAEAKSLRYQAESAETRAALLDAKIDRANVKATIGGTVLVGDFTERLGDVIQKGEPLFEIAPEGGEMRAVLSVEERDIQRFGIGDVGYLATKSEPGEKYAFVVTEVVPLSGADEGTNRFQVWGRSPATVDTATLAAGLDDEDQAELAAVAEAGPWRDTWRPGQQGQAKIDAGTSSYGYIFTHRLWDYLRIKLWL